MTDREMLELAAKAAGLHIDKSETNGGGIGNDGFCITGDAMLDWHNNIRWNPLRDDGDALRLAVKLRINLSFADGVEASSGDFAFGFPTTASLNADTHRAITRAAAERGKAMP